METARSEIEHRPPSTGLPVLTKDFSLLTQIWVNQVAFTHADDALPLLATDSVGPCVAVAGWNSGSRRGFLCHLLAGCDIEGTLLHAITKISDQQSSTTSISLWLTSGQSDGIGVPSLRSALERAREQAPLLTLVHNGIGAKGISGSSLVLDTRSGSAYLLDRTHAAARGLAPGPTETWEDLQVSLSRGPARIIYDSLLSDPRS